MKITDEMREAAARAIAIEINGADGAWDSPRFVRIAEATFEAVAPLIARAENEELKAENAALKERLRTIDIGFANAVRADLDPSFAKRIAEARTARHATTPSPKASK